MKKAVSIILTALGFMMFTGCATYYYSIETHDGKQFITYEEPVFDKKTQSYEFTDVKGGKLIVNREQIKIMEIRKKEN